MIQSPPPLSTFPPIDGWNNPEWGMEKGYDEIFSSVGTPRPHWRQFSDYLYAEGPGLPDRLWEETQFLLRDSGAVFTMPGRKADLKWQSWPYDPIPLIVDKESWNQLEGMLIQRHRLLSALLNDLYGAKNCLAEGILPASLVYQDPHYLLALGPCSHRSIVLPIHAVDLIRDPTGTFLVVSDRTQSPSGHGYTLQNRRFSNRLYPTRKEFSSVQSLLPFFRAMRSSLVRLSPRSEADSHVVMLTPGLANETHYEHTLLAHYLGLTLAQGGDLTVRGGRLRLKTLNGLLPVEVVVRRVDDHWCDPLELKEDSLLGIVGLTQAWRSGQVVLANPLGSGVLENLGLQPYLPRLCRYYLGEDLALNGPEIHWLGEEASRQRVMAEWGQWAILPVQPDPAHPINGSTPDAALQERVAANPSAYVARRPVQPSLTPSMVNGQISSRPVTLRAFVNHDGKDHAVMPGGLARVSLDDKRLVFSPLNGGMSKDIWIFSEQRPVESLPRVDRPLDPAPLAGISSRVAENLFWIGRYAERSESIIRLLREAASLHEEDSLLTQEQRSFCHVRLLATLTHVTATYPGFVGEGAEQRLASPERELRSLLFERDRPGTLAYSIRAMVQAGFSLRDRLTSDTWWVLDDVNNHLERLQSDRHRNAKRLFWSLAPLLHGLTAFSGLTWENMNRDLGWRFLDMGRRLERAMFLTHLLETTLARSAARPDEVAMLERVLRISDSLAAFRLHDHMEVAQVLERLLQDDGNPRSLVFQLSLMESHSKEVPRPQNRSLYRTRLGQVVFEVLAQTRLLDPLELAAVDPETGRRQALIAFSRQVRELLPLFSETATNSYFRHADPNHHLFTTVLGEGP